MAEITRFVQEFPSLSGPYQTEPVPSRQDVKDMLLEVSESLESLGRGWTFAILNSRNHTKVRSLLLSEPVCNEELIGDINNLEKNAALWYFPG
jgi:hypothetical protein